MKPKLNHLIHRPNPMARFAVVLVTGLVLLATSSCGKQDSWSPFGRKESAGEAAFNKLESRFEDLKAQLTGSKTSDDRAAFWQATTALFIVLSGFALVGGAALGSRARRDSDRLRESMTSAGADSASANLNPEEPTV